MTGEQVRDCIEAALKPLSDSIGELKHEVKSLGESINGNGHLGLKGRLTRVETILAIVGAIAIFATSMASCAISSRVIGIPTYQGGSAEK